MSGPAAARGLLLGVGNVHRRDDGIGPALVRRLRPRLPRGWSAAVERGDDIARLLAAWEGADVAFVIDAAMSDRPPGTLAFHDADAGGDAAAGAGDPSSHGFGLREAAALSRALGTLPRTFRIVSVAGADFGHGTGLSPELAARLDGLAAAVAARLTEEALAMEEAGGCTKPR